MTGIGILGRRRFLAGNIGWRGTLRPLRRGLRSLTENAHRVTPFCSRRHAGPAYALGNAAMTPRHCLIQLHIGGLAVIGLRFSVRIRPGLEIPLLVFVSDVPDVQHGDMRVASSGPDLARAAPPQ